MRHPGLCSSERLWPNRVRFEGSRAYDAAESRLGLGCSQKLPVEAFGNPVRDAPDRGPHNCHCHSRGAPEGVPVRHNVLDALERGLSAVSWTTNRAPNQWRRCPHRFSRSAVEWPPNPSDGSPSALALPRPLLRSLAREDRGTQLTARLRLLTVRLGLSRDSAGRRGTVRRAGSWMSPWPRNVTPLLAAPADRRHRHEEPR